MINAPLGNHSGRTFDVAIWPDAVVRTTRLPFSAKQAPIVKGLVEHYAGELTQEPIEVPTLQRVTLGEPSKTGERKITIVSDRVQGPRMENLPAEARRIALAKAAESICAMSTMPGQLGILAVPISAGNPASWHMRGNTPTLTETFPALSRNPNDLRLGIEWFQGVQPENGRMQAHYERIYGQTPRVVAGLLVAHTTGIPQADREEWCMSAVPADAHPSIRAAITVITQDLLQAPPAVPPTP